MLFATSVSSRVEHPWMDPSSPTPAQRQSHTKIVATLGPASSSPQMLRELILAGADVFRINTAHGSREQHQRALDLVRQASQETGTVVAVLVDLAGPKIRLGELVGGQHECLGGEMIRFVRGEHSAIPSDFTASYPTLIDELGKGDRVMLADGTVALRVETVSADAASCRVVQGGLIRSRQGVNLPGVKLSVEAMSEQDRDNAVWAAKAGVDFISLSFVRQAEDIRQLKALIASTGSRAHVVAKIEKPEALENLESIVRETDAVMVARGDLGVEVDIAQLPVIQKRIIAECTRFKRPVIVATQMLDSMQRSRLPTRAEATDVATAIFDGADACMLSGETAIGLYPREAVEMMHRIALATESVVKDDARPPVPPDLEHDIGNPITTATAWQAGRLATRLKAKMIVVISASGQSALALSTSRLVNCTTIGISDSPATLRQMCLYWGVLPLPNAPADDADRALHYAIELARSAGHVHTGDRVVMLAGTGLKASKHNAIIVHEVE